MQLNKSEAQAYAWLQKKYKETEIVFRIRKNPDFVLADGSAYEVKRLYGQVIRFSEHQFEELKNMENVQVIVTSDDMKEPLCIPMSELYDGQMTNGVMVKVFRDSGYKTSIPLNEQTKKRLCKVQGAMMMDNGNYHGVEAVINELIDFWEENKK